MRNIPGCTEQFYKVLGAIQESHQRHKSITICWMDLASAYGSDHHHRAALFELYKCITRPQITLDHAMPVDAINLDSLWAIHACVSLKHAILLFTSKLPENISQEV